MSSAKCVFTPGKTTGWCSTHNEPMASINGVCRLVAIESALSAKGLPERLRDWWDFLATRMNHPKDSSSELKAERPALLDDLREAAEALKRRDAFLDWLIAMDEPGSGQRRTVTLTMIIERAKDVRR